MIKVLVIGDAANYMNMVSKCVKKSKIHVINFPRAGASKLTYDDNVEYFESNRISKCVKKINEIKNDYDVCLVIFNGATIAYLAGLNYMMCYVGGDIEFPIWEKNPGEPYLKEPIQKHNFLQRWFYKNVQENAIACSAIGEEYVNKLKKYRKDAIRINTVPYDVDFFNQTATPLDRKKEKFTIFSPSRCCYYKKLDVFWKAIPLCKSDFEVLQVEWFDERTSEESSKNRELFKNKPSNVKSIPLIKRDEMINYYAYADAVIGDSRLSTAFGFVEAEAALLKKPVIKYVHPNAKLILDEKPTNIPFFPKSLEPVEFANFIDKLVQSKDFRDEIIEEQYNFMNKASDPNKVGEEWDKIFENIHQKHKNIQKDSDTIILFRNIYFQIVNQLYFRKVKKLASLILKRIFKL